MNDSFVFGVIILSIVLGLYFNGYVGWGVFAVALIFDGILEYLNNK